jgi:trk system potassium uptake protein TrkH
MIAYFTGSCVGSTAGGIKFLRIIIMRKYLRLQIHNVVNGKKDHSFIIDGVKYTSDHAAIVALNIVMYFLVFLLGGTIIFLLINPVLTAVD